VQDDGVWGAISLCGGKLTPSPLTELISAAYQAARPPGTAVEGRCTKGKSQSDFPFPERNALGAAGGGAPCLLTSEMRRNFTVTPKRLMLTLSAEEQPLHSHVQIFRAK